ncbi:MAG: response regulator [Anaerolineales bacterium]|nr:response regulator [Anaerolineales bacterium]
MSGILIVDDMPVIRSTLVNVISKKEMLFSPILEAANGEEAVALTRIHKPDIILMDIKMPVLNGLQATATIRQEQPNVKILMLSAYDEFSYVQKALKLGARDYLLKPVRPNKLLDLLVEVQQEIQDERRDLRTVEIVKESLQKTLPIIETNLVENLIRGTNPEGTTIDEALAYLGKRIQWPVVLVIKVDNFDLFSQGKTKQTLQQFHTDLVKLVHAMLPDPQGALIGYSNSGRIIVILSANQSLATARQLHEFGESICRYISASLPVTVKIGLGKRHMEVESIPLSYAEANLARRYYGRSQENQVVGIDDIVDDLSDNQTSSSFLVQKELQLVQFVQLNQNTEANLLINEIVDYLSKNDYVHPNTMKNHCAELVTLVAWGAVNAGLDEPKILELLHEQVRALSSWNSAPEIRAWTLNSLSEMMTLVEGISQRQDAIEDAVEYIHENFRRSDLMQKEVADAVSLSQSHFSSQFKVKMKMSYVKYLTAIRLDEAKKLLLTTDHSIAGISEMVGYPNVTNFYRHFRSHTKMTPAAYREAHSH